MNIIIGYQQQQQQQRPMGVYLMPPQQYMASNQYIVSYPQGAGAGVQPMYYPTMSWQSQQQYNSSSSSNGSINNSSLRPHYDQQRRLNHNTNNNTPNHMSKWEAHTNSLAYQSHRPAYSNNNYRGGYRKRGGGGFSSSHSSSTRGRGGGYNNTRHSTVSTTTSRYPDVHTVPSEEQPQQQP